MFSFLKQKDPHARLHEILGDYELPRFRKTIFETLSRLRDPKATSKDIAEVMSMDADLTSKVMRTVNSLAYAPKIPIKGLDHAVTMLGKSELERVVMMVGAKVATPTDVPSDLNLSSFWLDASLRAVIARDLANLVDPSRAGLCFSSGFLEDLSVPIIATSKGNEYVEVYKTSIEGQKPLHEIEQETFGWDHAELGALVCNEWDLPEDIGAAISAQNEPISELRPDPVYYVSDLSAECNEGWGEHFKDQVMTCHQVNEEVLDSILEGADDKARDLVRLIS